MDRRERLLPPNLGSDLRDLREDLEDLRLWPPKGLGCLDARLRPPITEAAGLEAAGVEEVPNIDDKELEAAVVPDICFI